MSYPPNYNACNRRFLGLLGLVLCSFFLNARQKTRSPDIRPRATRRRATRRNSPAIPRPATPRPVVLTLPRPVSSFFLFCFFFLLFPPPSDGAPAYGQPGVVVAGNQQAALQADLADGRLDGRSFGAPVVNAGGPPVGYGAPVYAPGQVYVNRKGKTKTYKMSKGQKKSMKHGMKHGYPPGGY